MSVLAKTKISKYFRTTVPREVRKILETKENDTVEWVLKRQDNSQEKQRKRR